MPTLYQTVNGTGIATALIVDWAVVPFNVAVAVELQNGTGTFKVQYTLNNPNIAIDGGYPGYLGTAANTTVTWFDDVNIAANSTTSLTGNYMFPVRALRVNVASAGAAMQLQFSVVQGYPS